jgi:hypothetical protein
MVVRPVTRHGLVTEALEKQMCHFPLLAYFVVSTMVGWIIWSQGVAGSPCGAIRRCAIWRSKSAWTKYFDWAVAGALELCTVLGPAVGVLVELHAAAASAMATSTAVTAVPRLGMG